MGGKHLEGQGPDGLRLQQLAQADVMLSELKGRNSYRTLVGLIVTANTALNNLIGNPAC